VIFVSFPPGGAGHKLGRIIGTSKKFLYPAVVGITPSGKNQYDDPVYGSNYKKYEGLNSPFHWNYLDKNNNKIDFQRVLIDIIFNKQQLDLNEHFIENRIICQHFFPNKIKKIFPNSKYIIIQPSNKEELYEMISRMRNVTFWGNKQEGTIDEQAQLYFNFLNTTLNDDYLYLQWNEILNITNKLKDKLEKFLSVDDIDVERFKIYNNKTNDQVLKIQNDYLLLTQPDIILETNHLTQND